MGILKDVVSLNKKTKLFDNWDKFDTFSIALCAAEGAALGGLMYLFGHLGGSGVKYKPGEEIVPSSLYNPDKINESGTYAELCDILGEGLVCAYQEVKDDVPKEQTLDLLRRLCMRVNVDEPYIGCDNQ